MYVRAVSGPRLLLAIVLVVGAMCAALLGLADPAAPPIVRWTARTSLVLFTLVYVARPSVQLWPSAVTKGLLARRKWLGLGFAASHTYHFAGIVGLGWPDVGGFFARTPPNPLGVAAYVALAAMTVTSIDRVRRSTNRRWWRGIHLTGVHLAWVVFIGSYAKRVDAQPLNVVPVVLLLGIGAIRAAAWIKRVRARRASPVAHLAR